MASTPFESVLERLAGVQRNGVGYKARCPAHDDAHVSLSIHEGNDGRVLLKCFAGCSAEAIAGALGLQVRELFPQRGSTVRTPYRMKMDPPSPPLPEMNGLGGEGGSSSSPVKPFEQSNRSGTGGEGGASSPPVRIEQSNGLTLEAYAAAKRLPVAFLRGLGLSDMHYLGAPALRIPYRDPDGSVGAVRFRRLLEKGAQGDDRFAWKSGSKVRLYGLDRLEEARAAGYVLLVEGESDCQTAWHHGLPAVGVAGANNWSDTRDARHLEGIGTIYAVIEPDTGGAALEKKLEASSVRRRVRLVGLGADKDVSGLHLRDPDGFRAAWGEAAARAVLWIDRERESRESAARADEARAAWLLDAPDFFGRLADVIRRRGYAGDTAPVQRVYVAMTSRLLERPINVAVVSASATGKNKTVDAAAELLPAEAIYVEKAGSARALVYTDDGFEHRVVVVGEADSIPDDGPAASAIRSIAEDNEMRYDVVERDEETGRFTVRHIVKPGPTSLVTTSTKSVHHQLGTRMLEMPIPDDEQQTRAVLQAHAAAVQRADGATVDLTPWIAFQRYLASTGIRRVEVPFARALAAAVPAKAVRMRRDFRQLLTFVEAAALLRVKQRRVLGDGWIAADYADYADTRALLAPIFEVVAAEGCTPAVRQTVEAVKPDEEVTGAQIAERLDLARSTVSWRIARAIDGGWLVNKETRRGQPQRLARGAALPSLDSVLPTVDELKAMAGAPAPDWVEDELGENGA